MAAGPIRSAARAPADQTAVRRNNLALVLRQLRDSGPRSRARLAVETGLNKATVSSLVAELVDRGLVREVGTSAGAVGRPATILELGGHAVAAVGLEVKVGSVAALASDLTGDVIYENRRTADTARQSVAMTMRTVVQSAKSALRAVESRGATVTGVTVAVPGLVDVARGVATTCPNLGWTDVPVADALRRGLGRDDLTVRIDNDANLSALAEYWSGVVAGERNLVYLTGDVGVGAGVIVDGSLLRGALGFSGEVGHMPLAPFGPLCGCGRRGCWEALIGLNALLARVSDGDERVGDPMLDLDAQLAEVERRAQEGDARTIAALAEIGTTLGLGTSILVNLFNPHVVVLGGYLARLGPWLLDTAMASLREHVLAPDAAGCRLELSDLGFMAAVRGGAGIALESVLADPTIVPRADRASAATERAQELV